MRSFVVLYMRNKKQLKLNFSNVALLSKSNIKIVNFHRIYKIIFLFMAKNHSGNCYKLLRILTAN